MIHSVVLVPFLLFFVRKVFCLLSNATAITASRYAINDLQHRGIVDIEDRLAIVMLQSSLHQLESVETIHKSQLVRCLHLLSRHVADTTPLVTYVFSRSTSNEVKQNFKTNFTDVYPNLNLILIYIDDTDWTLPEGRSNDKKLWVGGNHFDTDYRLMGTWRLYFPFMFSKYVGHKYFCLSIVIAIFE